MRIVVLLCILFVYRVYADSSIFGPVCARDGRPNYNQTMCSPADTTLFPSWCRYNNPFSAPFLFSDEHYANVTREICDTNGECTSVMKIRTLEAAWPEGLKQTFTPRFIVFALYPGRLVVVNFNTYRIVDYYETNQSIQFLETLTFGNQTKGIVVAAGNISTNIYYGEMPSTLVECQSIPHQRGYELVDLKLLEDDKKAYIVELNKLSGRNEYTLSFTEFSSCTKINKKVMWRINTPDTKLRFLITHQYTNYTSQLIATQGHSNRTLITLYDEQEVKIIQFNETLQGLQLNFGSNKDIDLIHTFYRSKPSERITVVSVLMEQLRRVNLSESSCQHITGAPAQAVFLVIATFDKVSKLVLKDLTEFAAFEFNKLSNFTNPANRQVICPDINMYFNGQKCVLGNEFPLAVQSSRHKIKFLENRFLHLPHGFEIFDDLIANTLDIQGVCDLLAQHDKTLYLACIEIANRTKCGMDFLSDMGGFAMSMIMQKFWMHHIYAVTEHDREVEVIGVQKQLCSPDAKVFTELFNRYAVIGKVKDVHVSPNAQHMFITVTRRKWELDTINRFAEICAVLEVDPDNIFLKGYHDACTENPPQAIDLNQYGMYISACMSGSFCPSLNYNIMEKVPAGYYTYRPNNMTLCKESYFCQNGVRVLCPQGFHCPDRGMTTPIACPQHAEFNTTCSQEGLTNPIPCPAGTTCIAPYFPPLPVSEGNYQQLPSRDIKVCSVGDWCPIGRFLQANETREELLCPANTYCTEPTVLTPIICQCNASQCSECPAGTSVEELCDAGYYCMRPDEKKLCSLTQYCPNGTVIPQPCPAGFYCPTPSEKVLCPMFYKCPTGSVKPTVCPLLSVCPPGSSADQPIIIGATIDVGIIVFIIVAYYVYVCIRDAMRKKGDERRKKHITQEPQPVVISDTIVEDEILAFDVLEQPKPTSFTMSISFSHLKLIASKKVIIENLSGRIRGGKLTAVMGLSGSGKTSLLNVLAGRAFYGTVTGEIKINGRRDNLRWHRGLVGYVPQDDIMLRTMTVEETLYFAARCRLDSGKYAREVNAIVERAIRILGLEDIRYSIIGDEKQRGISGGQRKRVNVAMELVADPCVLFLDEPTSGLDSASSNEVCKAMREISETGITVITVIHQPRFEIFRLFHDVILLGKGGNVVYMGPTDTALDYFESLGFKCPEHVNPPDFFMDIISGDVSRENNSSFRKEDLFGMWRQRASTVMGEDDSAGTASLAEEEKKRSSSFILALAMVIKRSVLQQVRDLSGLFLDNLLVYMAGLSLGMIFYNQYYIGPPPQPVIDMCPGDMKKLCELPIDDPIINQASLIPLSMGLCAVMSSLSTFGDESLVFTRESISNISPLAYFLGKNLTQLPRIAITPLVFLSIYFTLNSPRGNVFEYYLILLLCHFTAFGFGYFISIAIRPQLAQIAAVVMILVFQLIAGARPTLPQMQTMPFPLPYVPYISYIRYGQEALYLLEVKWYAEIYNIQSGLKLFGYHEEDLLWCILMVPAIGIAIRVLAYMSLLSSIPGSLMHRITGWILDVQGHKDRAKSIFSSVFSRNTKDAESIHLLSVTSPIESPNSEINSPITA